MYQTKEEHYNAIQDGVQAEQDAFEQLAFDAPKTETHTLNQIWDWCNKNRVSTSDKKELGLFWAFELCEALGESEWRDLVWAFEYRPYNPIKRATAQLGVQKIAVEFYWVKDRIRYCEYLQFNKVEFFADNDGVNFISTELVQKILA